MDFISTTGAVVFGYIIGRFIYEWLANNHHNSGTKGFIREINRARKESNT
jgi:hypothetical protein